MTEKCFVCTTGKIQRKSGTVNSMDNSLLLCQILELNHLENNSMEKFNEINYCGDCMRRITKIGNMIEELEKLEKKVLEEKYMIEVKFKKKSQNHHKNHNSIDQLRVEIVTELRSTSIKSMMKKIRMKQIGRKSAGGKSPTIPIMEMVTIPRNQNIEDTIMGPKLNTTQGDSVTSERSRSRSTSHQQNSTYQSRPESTLENHNFDIESVANHDATDESPNTNVTMDMTTCPSTMTECDIKLKPNKLTDKSDAVVSSYKLYDVVPEQCYIQGNNWINTIPTTSVGTSIKHEVDVPTQFDEVEFPQVHPISEGPSNNTSNFSCTTCSASFVRYNQLKIHRRLHFRTGRTSTSDVYGNKSHKRARNSPSLRPKKCDECGKILSRLHTWRNHVLQVHRREHKYKCPQCSFGCQLISDMKLHLTTHSDERNFKCHRCDRAFKNEIALRKHHGTKLCSLNVNPSEFT